MMCLKNRKTKSISEFWTHMPHKMPHETLHKMPHGMPHVEAQRVLKYIGVQIAPKVLQMSLALLVCEMLRLTICQEAGDANF